MTSTPHQTAEVEVAQRILIHSVSFQEAVTLASGSITSLIF